MDMLFFNLDASCNMSCGYCFYNTGHLKKPPTTLDESDWTRAVEEAVEMRLGGIIFTGGEPLLGGAPRLEMLARLIRKAREGGIYTLLLTNGYFFTKAAAEKLADAGLGAVSISQDTLSGVAGYKVAGWRAAEAAVLQDLRVTIIMTLTVDNLNDLPAVYRFARTRGHGLIIQPAFIPQGHELFPKLSLHSLPDADIKKLLVLFELWAKNYGTLNYFSYLKEIFGIAGGKKPFKCDMGTRAAIIEPDGSYIACFHRPDVKAGNIGKEKLADLTGKMKKLSSPLGDAHCFGEHCVSLFTQD